MKSNTLLETLKCGRGGSTCLLYPVPKSMTMLNQGSFLRVSLDNRELFVRKKLGVGAYSRRGLFKEVAQSK